jgi:hypothetical protein
MDDLVKQLLHATVLVDDDIDAGGNVRDAAVERLERYGWQPIETAPKDETTIVATRNEVGHRSYTLIFWSIVDHEWAGYTAEDEKRLVKFQPTHWMPLPEPPTND